MAAPNRAVYLDFTTYLQHEQDAEIRHELIAGGCVAMAGATENHAKIAGNVFAHVWRHLRDSPCTVYATDMKLKAGPDCYYPDVFVTCADTDNDVLVKEQPVLIVEVLSDSTESLDKGRKLVNYLNLPSLQEYVLISQGSIELLFYRNTATGWELEIVRGGGAAHFASLGLDVAVADLYAKVTFVIAD